MRIALTATLVMILAAPTIAAALTPTDARRAFLGLDMRGYVEGSNAQWRECINPAGVTSYWIEGSFDEGRLRIRDDGVLCFSYKSASYADEACFTAAAHGANWRFVDVADPRSVFVTTHTRKNVKACPTTLAPVS